MTPYDISIKCVPKKDHILFYKIINFNSERIEMGYEKNGTAC